MAGMCCLAGFLGLVLAYLAWGVRGSYPMVGGFCWLRPAGRGGVSGSVAGGQGVGPEGQQQGVGVRYSDGGSSETNAMLRSSQMFGREGSIEVGSERWQSMS